MSTLKHKGKGPQAMTANLLRGGYSVWLTPSYEWSQDYDDALRTEDVDQIQKLGEIGDRDEASNLVVGAYFIDVEPDTALPVRYREKFRVRGPSYDTADLIKGVS